MTVIDKTHFGLFADEKGSKEICRGSLQRVQNEAVRLIIEDKQRKLFIAQLECPDHPIFEVKLGYSNTIQISYPKKEPKTGRSFIEIKDKIDSLLEVDCDVNTHNTLMGNEVVINIGCGTIDIQDIEKINELFNIKSISAIGGSLEIIINN